MSKPINLNTLELRLRRGEKISSEALLAVVAEMRAQREVARIARLLVHDEPLPPSASVLRDALVKLDAVWR